MSKVTPIESLRKAQIEMPEGRLSTGGAGHAIGAPESANPKGSRLRKRVHPRYWAAWSISGPPTLIDAPAQR